jgi:hypothetical protein
MKTIIYTMRETTASRSPKKSSVIACAALWPKPAALKSNRVLRSTVAACVQGHAKRAVDSQPTTIINTAAVTGDPHEEGFDFGPHVRAPSHQQLHARQMALLSCLVNRSLATTAATSVRRSPSLSQKHNNILIFLVHISSSIK